ncbi:hypothetical protein [Mycolicibacterium brisbanense]|uniref:hypothetical protein n=1 Tax=Mycolicibacterium brisbanense TaxID=146020 RepID=UPI000AEC0959|nr:hypothetical protein [Mycolicibacterium brisbanense]MCV7159641.1 hypothetical protein [Mycolicibacterium brisbanense]
MAKHRKASERSVRTRTLVAGVLAGGALAAVVPASIASASTDPSADAVKRPAFGNPAPGVRVAQAVGDKVFNQTPGINKTLDDSPLGEGYHINFGTPAGGVDTSTRTASNPNPAPLTTGTNGAIQGELNVNAGKYYYDQTQKWAELTVGNKILPDESDLPGTLPKAVAGANTLSATSAKPSNANKSLTCVAAATCNH